MGDIVKSEEEAREWFNENATGTVIAERDNGERKEVDCYPAAFRFFKYIARNPPPQPKAEPATSPTPEQEEEKESKSPDAGTTPEEKLKAVRAWREEFETWMMIECAHFGKESPDIDGITDRFEELGAILED